MAQLRQHWGGNFSGMLCWEGAWLPTQPEHLAEQWHLPKSKQRCPLANFGFSPAVPSPWHSPATHLWLCRRSRGAWLEQEERQKRWSFSVRAAQSSPSVPEQEQ